MELPMLAVNGAIPVMSPWLVTSLCLLVLGLWLALLALMRRNLRLVLGRGLNPFSPADAQRASNPLLTTRRPGEASFTASSYGRFALGCIAVGAVGSSVITLWQLFAG